MLIEAIQVVFVDVFEERIYEEGVVEEVKNLWLFPEALEFLQIHINLWVQAEDRQQGV